MKKLAFFYVLILINCFVFAQNTRIDINEIISNLTAQEQDKIVSGQLIEKISQKQTLLKSGLAGRGNTTNVIIYLSDYPNENELLRLGRLGIRCFSETWTPAVGRHPFGFLVASLPVDKLREALSLPFIKKMDTAERRSMTLNNNAARSVKANLVWGSGHKGSGVKVGILDSGIDLSYAGSDLPATFEYKDYSDFPNLDDIVSNTITGHGTHVAATLLGRGVLSAGKSPDYNGEGSFSGIAPEASLTFLKIGNDSTASASDAAIIAAIDAAVNTYHVKVLSMSYGGWDTYHDGTSALDQKVDWAYSKGVPFFLSAGNSAKDNKHWSGTVGAFSESDFIDVRVVAADTNDTRLRFNLVWNDGSNRKNLTLRYYDSAKKLISDITFLTTTESSKGIESQYSYSNFFVPRGDKYYYLKVVNNSSQAQTCHIYEDWSNLEEGNTKVSFLAGDPNYTIGCPSTADFGFAVGAYVTRDITFDYQNNSWVNGGYIKDSLALFSSWGPRMDGVLKPDICAPGSMIISLRDKDVYKTPDKYWIDNDGITGAGDANYYRMHGTSMACPVAAGCAALYLEQKPDATPQELYAAFRNFSNKTGLYGLPNNKWGAGKLNMANVLNLVELLSPANGFQGISPTPTLVWDDRANAVSYNVQVSRTEDFVSPVINLTGIDTSFVVVEGLNINTTYYWHVQCVSPTGNGSWSEIRSFTTGGNLTNAGYALWFDGVNDYVSVPHGSAIDSIEINDVISIEAWVNIEKWSADLFPIIEKYKPSIDWGWSFQLHNSTGMELGLIWSSANQPTALALNSWNHVAVTYKKSEGKARFYLNGNLIGEKNISDDIPDTDPGDPLYIGLNASGGDEYSSGIIDEVRIWKVVRTAKQIKDNMYRSLNGSDPNLVANFSFNEGKNFKTTDRSGNLNNGTLVNGPIWVVSTVPQPCFAPIVGSITQPTCAVPTGSVVITSLPAAGTWTLTRIPGGITKTGTGSSTTVTGLPTGIYSFSATDSSGCVSPASTNVVINAQPEKPAAPIVGLITQPTCTVGTGSVGLSGLPGGNWAINPGNIIGSGSSKTINSLIPGVYTFTVTNEAGCISAPTSNIVINAQPVLPAAADRISGSTTACQGTANVNYSVPSINGATSYIWTLPWGTEVTTSINLLSINFGIIARSGALKVKGRNVCGDGSESMLYINVYTPPAKPVVTQNTDTLTSSSASGNQWYYNSNLISGATNQKLTISKSGQYYVIVTTSQGCVSLPSDVFTATYSWSDGIRDYQLKIYPNPTSGIITIAGLPENRKLRVSVLDMGGRVVKKQTVTSVEPTVNISHVTPGSYFLVIDGQVDKAVKIVKE